MTRNRDRNRNDDIYTFIGSRIKQFRTTQNMSQDELASRSSLKRPSIVLIEKGRQKLPIDRLFVIAKALKVEPAQLLPSLNDIYPGDSDEYPIFVHGAETLAVNEVSTIKKQLQKIKEQPKREPNI